MSVSKITGFHPKYGVALFKRVINNFGYKYFFFISSGYLAIVGFVQYLVITIQLPYYQAANIDGQIQSEMSAIAKIPWACKGFIGVLSDLFPIAGRYKFYYFLIYFFLGTICCACLAFLPFSLVAIYPWISATLYFGFNLCSAGFDLLMEAKNIEMMQRNPAIKADLVTFSWFFETVGQLFPSVLVGIVADLTDVRLLFYIFFPTLLLPLPFIFLGGVIEDKVVGNRKAWDMDRFKSQWQLIVLTTLQATFTVGSVLTTFLTSPMVQLVFLVAVSLLLVVMAYMMLDRMVADFNLFTYINYSFYVNIQGALEYYYVDKDNCTTDSPRFSYTIVSTMGPFAFTIAQFLAIFLFQVVFTDWRFRTVIWFSTFLRMCAAISDIILVKRWNLAIRIPDEILFILGYGTFAQVCYVIDVLATVYLMAKVCPRKYEATMFAFLAGLFHFGKTSAINIGVYLMDLFNIQTIPIPEKGIECNYDGLVSIIIIGHLILPAITIPLVYLLLPNTRLNEQIRNDYDQINTFIKDQNINNTYTDVYQSKHEVET